MRMDAVASADHSSGRPSGDAERALHESELRKAAIIESSLDCIILMDDRGLITEFNPAAERTFQRQRSAVIGRPLAEMIIPERYRQDHWRGLQKFLDTNEGPILGKRVEIEAMRADGSEFPVELAVVPVRIGSRMMFTGHLRDITERRSAQQALADAARRFKWLMDNTTEAIWRFEMDEPCRIDLPEDEQVERFYRHGWLAEANEAMARMYGFANAAEMVGLRLGDILIRADPRNEAFLRAFIRSNYRLIDAESIETAKDGSIKHVLNSFVGEIENGLGLRAWGTTRDITERKLAETALRESEERLRLAVAAADLGTWDLDPATGIATCSQRAKEMYGFPPDAAVTRDGFIACVHPDDRERVRKTIERALDRANAGHYAVEYRVQQQERTRWLASRGQAFFDEGGKPTRLIGSTLDISGRKQIQEALEERTSDLERSNSELERSNVELEQFAYIASHDLQEPLRMVVNYMNLLKRRYSPSLDDKANEYMGYAVDGALRMQALIKGLLDYSRVGAAHAPGAVDSGAVLADALANLSPKILASGATITQDPLPEVVADRTMLTLVFQNLIANGIKFRGADTPTVHVSCERRDRDCVFSVRDNGIGIDPEHHSNIFQIFRRLHTREEYPGTGIGLAAVKKIVERHGGKVWIESAPGKGSTFLFTIPARRDPSTLLAVVQPTATGG
ncbi:MAG: PAS domain S-box protein [Planctomycetes bacterium]|nr:PAS domain S-box protein [Planctomycetota bacterium]